ncbi:MAG: mechanosensitive ion channel family protein [Blastochloris sp.]|nr:mechanosensitive ion channel family protein [Blastochloris sp.]
MLQGREHVVSDSVLTLFTEYDSSALNILIRCYVMIEDWTQAHEERQAVNLEIMRIVDALGMRLAVPSRSLYVEQVSVEQTPANGYAPTPADGIASATGESGMMARTARSASVFRQGDDDNMKIESAGDGS